MFSSNNETNIKYAHFFDIEHRKGFVLLTVYNDDQKKEINKKYILVKKGDPLPSLLDENEVIRIPISSIACLSSVYVAYVDRLKLHDQLIAVDNMKYINSPSVKKLFENEKLIELGNDEYVDLEKLVKIKPALLFTYFNTAIVSKNKFEELGIPTAYSLDHLENSPLARAEWIKFMSAFFDKEKEANRIFDSISDLYIALTKKVLNVTYRPSVFSGIKYADAWYVPGGKSYMAQLFIDAGANYLWSSDGHSGSLPLTYEEVYSKALNADYWLNVYNCNSLKDVLKMDNRYQQFNAYKKGTIFNNNNRVNEFGGNDFWESGLLYPDLILADLIHLFHPSIMPKHQLHYYKKLN